MKPVILDINDTDTTTTYAPASAIMNDLKYDFNLPYASKFSFKPLIEQLHDRVKLSKCEITASMIPGIEALEVAIEEQRGNLTDEIKLEIEQLTKVLLPGLFFQGQVSFICPPFLKDVIYATEKMQELLDGDKWEVKLLNDNEIERKEFGLTQKAGASILNKFYGQNLDVAYGEYVVFRSKETGLEKHFKFRIRHDFVSITTSEDNFDSLDKTTINSIINNFYSSEKLLEYLPADHFSFEGFGIVTLDDVTEQQVVSIIKDAAIQSDTIKPIEFRELIGKHLKDYFGNKDLQIGFVNTHHTEGYINSNLSLSGYNNLKNFIDSNNTADAYQTAFRNNEPIIIDDLKSLKNPSIFEQALIDLGYQSLLLVPLVGNSIEPQSILEIACHESHAFNLLHLQKLEAVVELLNLGIEKIQKEINNKIDNFIKNQFTSIHPSVEWKFIEVAEKYEVRKQFDSEENLIEPIVFKDVFPLYGQADIVNSSVIRNEAIQKDLVENLELLNSVLLSFAAKVNFPLLESYIIKVEETLDILKEGYTSSLESYVIDLLLREIHPLLKQLKAQYRNLPERELSDYFASLDKEIGIVYKHRQAYEHSVAKLNSTISNYLDKEDEKLQKILPHYFEKYRTDGVEYSMYLGQSLLQDIQFSEFHLKDFKLWQLINICEVTRLVNQLEGTLPIPLQTAQLIFVYNSSLSIRFRMDEKQFDVDGTYNVRYEILKKRIDKAYIKGSEERLSQAGKVSIVYLLEKDKIEYLDYLNFLIKKGYINSNIEDLELEKLQGADGLKALRVKVI